ncbi:hypothetical protein BGZ61DRAFT_501313 [Ilyonectria robusta]|uniref:uncharacterized protein n=1 Tax=Ilyonectria robusta TaxID=1079257 RepID=UPI001E8EE999|nr:uncharacterized protein BGZ61DRAFT_501313 [Ilyonectria robusta]KAH8646440.1 hypothetical protein BGZ61DRAFT_501313 [Ilyonectria robusta]
MEFFDHPLKTGQHYDSILISALAVMGLDANGGWVTAANYTPVLSAIVKGTRYLVLYQSMLERREQIMRLQQTMSKRRAKEKADGLFRIIREKVWRFMTRMPDQKEADPTPMNWIINTRTYGMRIRFTTPGEEKIDWFGDEIKCGGVKISMGKISDIMHNAVAEARRTLAKLTMMATEAPRPVGRRGSSQEGQARRGEDEDEPSIHDVLPRIPWSRIEDRHGESTLGYSFLQDEANRPWTEAGDEGSASRPRSR